MPLADPDDPIVPGVGVVILHDVETDTFSKGTVKEYMERRPMPLFSSYNPIKELREDETPEADQQEQVVLAAVIALRLMGLPTDSIATMLNTDIHKIDTLISKPTAQKTFEHMFRGLINYNATTVQGKLAAFADNAVNVVVSMMNDETTRDDVRLKAAQDVLDRSGTNAEQFFTNDAGQTTQDDELRISFMTDEDAGPKVDVSITRKGKR